MHVHVFFASANFRKFVDAKKEAYVHPSIVFLYSSVCTHRILMVQCRLVPEKGYGRKQYRSSKLFVPDTENTVQYWLHICFFFGITELPEVRWCNKRSVRANRYNPSVVYGTVPIQYLVILLSTKKNTKRSKIIFFPIVRAPRYNPSVVYGTVPIQYLVILLSTTKTSKRSKIIFWIFHDPK